jgi:hypothetical protein
MTHYRHTQLGWVILAVLAGIVLLLLSSLPPEAAGAVRTPLVAGAAIVLFLFCALCVEVDTEAIRLRFGIGLIRKRIPLADVASWRAVRNPWYCGWGIRLGPRGVLWNVSGFDAVEIDLPGGRRFRVGTDEPEALVRAITQAKGVSAPPPADEGSPADARGVLQSGLGQGAVAVLLAGLALVAGLFWSQTRPVDVRVGPRGIEIDTPFYGTTLPAADIATLSLEPALPRILSRTNGFAGAGSLRGHFRVEGLGDGRLYVERGHPPYVLIRLRQGFVVVNLSEPDRTRALYEELARQWPDRAATSP